MFEELDCSHIGKILNNLFKGRARMNREKHVRLRSTLQCTIVMSSIRKERVENG